MDATNLAVLKQLQQYAQRYFDAIVELNSTAGECDLKPGKYSAKEMSDNSYKSIFGRSYELPEDECFDELIYIEAGNFKCSFPYRQIFCILAEWETMSRAGKLAAVFQIGDIEEKTVKVILSEKTAAGSYIRKRMRLRRLSGNWWIVRKPTRRQGVKVYYELNGVMFNPGLQVYSEEDAKERCLKYNDEWFLSQFAKILAHSANESDIYGYYHEVAKLAGIKIDNETTAQAIAEDSRRQEEQRKLEEEQAERDRQEEQRKLREADELKAEEEERQRKEYESRAIEKFTSGRMVDLDELETVARIVGYTFNPRTLGTLRRRIKYVEIGDDGKIRIYGTTRRAGLDGSFAAIREIYERAKAMICESSAQVAPTATETPQISTKSDSAGSESSEGEISVKTRQNMPTCTTYRSMGPIHHFRDLTKKVDRPTFARSVSPPTIRAG